MRKRDQSLLDAIEQSALAEDESVAAALRKCIALGGRAGSAELREWAVRELRGYQDTHELPAYRIVAAPIKIDGQTLTVLIKGQRISPRELPDVVAEEVSEDFELRQGIGEIEDLIAATRERCEASVGFSLPMGRDVARLMTSELEDRYAHVHEVYWQVSVSALAGVVEGVRTTLVELVSEIRAGIGDDDLPSEELASRAVSVAVHGRGSRVTVNAPQSHAGSAVASSSDGQGVTRSWKFWSVVVGLATIAGTIAAWLTVFS